MTFFRPICRAKITYRGFSSWVAVLTSHECLVVLYRRSYRFHAKTHARIMTAIQCSIDNLLISFNATWSIRLWKIQPQASSQDFLSRNCNRCELQNQFVASVDDALIILAKAQQHVERHAKIKVSFLRVGSGVLFCVQGNQRFVVRH